MTERILPARALDGAAVDDLITWKRPAGDQELEVVAIRYAEKEGA